MAQDFRDQKLPTQIDGSGIDVTESALALKVNFIILRLQLQTMKTLLSRKRFLRQLVQL